MSTERHQDVGYEERHVVGERLDAGAQAEHAGVPLAQAGRLRSERHAASADTRAAQATELALRHSSAAVQAQHTEQRTMAER